MTRPTVGERKGPGRLRTIEPTGLYTKVEVAELLQIHERSLQRFADLPWSDLGEHTPRMLGVDLLEWIKRRRREVAAA